MSTTEFRSDDAPSNASGGKVDMKLEVVVIPVSDVDRAAEAEFYGRLGWRLDADIANGDSRMLQFIPPGSPCSISFGTGVTPSAPSTAQFLHLVVSDIEAARNEFIGNGVDASEVFHDAGGGYNRFDADALIPASAVFLAVSPLSGALVARVGPRWLIVAGILVVATALLWLSQAQPGDGYEPAMIAVGAVSVAAAVVAGLFVADDRAAAPRLAPPAPYHGCALPVTRPEAAA